MYDDDDVLAGSLPSHSTFHTDVGSPPPPPPPAKAQVSTPAEKNAMRRSRDASPGVSSDGGSGSKPSTPGARPFLRKGSRVEPSALARIKRDGASPITAPNASPDLRSQDGAFNSGSKWGDVQERGHGQGRGSSGGGGGGGGFQFDPLPETSPAQVRRPASSKGGGSGIAEGMQRPPPSPHSSPAFKSQSENNNVRNSGSNNMPSYTRPPPSSYIAAGDASAHTHSSGSHGIELDNNNSYAAQLELSTTLDTDWQAAQHRRQETQRARERCVHSCALQFLFLRSCSLPSQAQSLDWHLVC